MKYITFVLIVLFFTGCERPTPTPATPGTTNTPGSTETLPDRIVNGLVPGCVDAFELVEQVLTLPEQQITFDVGNIIDRVGVVVEGATYSFSTRPVNPVTCGSTTLPAVAIPMITFGFNYLGDFTRVDPLCMNASIIEFSEFSISGTPLDTLVEGIVKEEIWTKVDNTVIEPIHSLINGSAFPGGANPRCNNWVDLSTL